MLSWIGNPATRVMLLIAAFICWTAYQRHDAILGERDRLTAEYAKATSEEIARQTKASEEAQQAATKRATASETKVKQLQELADVLQTELKTSGVSCAIPDSVRERLRSIH